MSENRGASLELVGLVKRYADAVALDGVSLPIPAGEFMTLLGPSGSGKTTTLNMIAGFVRPDEGHISMQGRAIDRLPPHKRDIGMVFQNYALFPHMTVEQNVAFPLKQRKYDRGRIGREVGAALEMVGLAGYDRRYPRQLSGGQQQRVALARALVFQPRVLLMDEPLGALDKRLREILQLEFKRIHRELGITFVYVTHDQTEALVMSDRIAVFNEGRIEQVGGAAELYERPRSLFVAQFLGDSNVLPGRYRAAGEVAKLVGDAYELAAPRVTTVSDGEHAAVVVRPERLHVARGTEEPGTGVNVLDGRVHQAIYMGALRRLEIDVRGGIRLMTQDSAADAAAVAEGDEVRVWWHPDSAVVLPARSGVDAPSGALLGASAIVEIQA